MTNVKENIDMINEMGNTGYESIRALTDLNLSTWNKLMEKQMDTLNSVMENSMEQMKQLSEAKNYQDAARVQMEMGRKISEELMGKTRETVELAQKAGEEYRTLFEGNVATAKEQMTQAAEKVAEAAEKVA